MGNTLTGLLPTLYAALDTVSREQVGFIPAVFKNSNAERAALNEDVRYPIVPTTTLSDVVPGSLPPDDGDQTVGYGTLTITKSKYAPVRWTGEEQKGVGNSGMLGSIVQQQFEQAFRTICNAVEADLAAIARAGASRAYGTAGTAPFSTAGNLSDIAQVRKILVDNGAPTTNLKLVMDSTAGANMRGIQNTLFRVNEAGTADLLRQGILGQLQGFNLHESGQVAAVTKGTGASYVTSGSTAPGVTDIALVTGTGTVLAGDVVTFAADANNKYVIGTGVAAPGTISLNKPGAKVTIATANALTVGNTYTANTAFDGNAIHLVTRAPAMPEGGDDADDVTEIQDPVSGLVFQVAVYRQYRRIKYEVALAWGVGAVKPAHIATLMG